jgi:hypothetical protein
MREQSDRVAQREDNNRYFLSIGRRISSVSPSQSLWLFLVCLAYELAHDPALLVKFMHPEVVT